jgi:hypothetical protein
VAAGTAEVLVPNGDGDDAFMQLAVDAEVHANRDEAEGIKAVEEHTATQPAFDEEFKRIVAATTAEETSNVIEVGMMFPRSQRFAEILPQVQKRRRAAFNSGHLIFRHPNPPIHRS